MIPVEGNKPALSGYAELEMVIAAVNGGAIYKFITKPWDEKVLRHRIREAFMHHELKKGEE